MSIHAITVKNRIYIIKDIMKNGKHSTTTIERLGSASDIMEKHKCEDAMAWAREYALELDKKERESNNPEGSRYVLARENVRIAKGEAASYNIGYLPLQKIFFDLKIPGICRSIKKQHGFTYNFESVFSRLIYAQILFPGSKYSTTAVSKRLFEQPDFEYHQVLRALDVIDEHFDDILAKLFKNSKNLVNRKTGVVYYDCTNYFFEIEQEDTDSHPPQNPIQEEEELTKGLRKYGYSKEHRPNPIVQVGLLMDRTGLPVTIIVSRGSRNEQTTLRPVEEKIQRDYGISKFVVCTDSGLSGIENRKYNNYAQRAFITTVSIKKMKKSQQRECMRPTGWKLKGSDKTYDISELDSSDEKMERYYDVVFYKEIPMEEYDEERDIRLNQVLVVTYSVKYREYQRNVRNRQIERARSAILQGAGKIEKKNQNDFRRFVKTKNTTKEGEEAIKTEYMIDDEVVAAEEKYDGFYAVIHNLEESEPDEILEVVKGRWEIEESFRITKTGLRARPIYLSKPERIRAHLLIVFISLLFYRILERKLGHSYTDEQILKCLRGMYIAKYPTEAAYHPSYTRTDITDDVNEYLGFCTDYEYISDWVMRGNCLKTKGGSKRKEHADEQK